ncbi:MAG TPA: PaaI family thioesterase [Spirochaetia bacterium]
METSIERDNSCFCCGAANERGLRLSIEHSPDGSAETSTVVPPWFSGWKNMTHGGFLSTLLDEIMAHACIGISQQGVTAELTVRFQKPVETGTRIRAVGKVKEARGRVISTEGWLYGEDGAVVATATARFISVASKK